MRYKLAAAAAGLACGLVASAQEPPEGRYVSKAGGFSVVFPGGGDVRTKTQDVPGGLKLTSVGTETPAKAYMVMFLEYPAELLKAAPADLILDVAARGRVTNSGGTEVSTKKMTFGKAKHPGREIVILLDGEINRTQLFLAGSMLYGMGATGKREVIQGKEGDAFFKSFELLPAAKN